MRINSVDFVSFYSTDIQRSRGFYEGVLGLVPTEVAADGNVEYQIGGLALSVADPTVWGMPYATNHSGSIALNVDDVAAARDELVAKGIEVSEPIDTGVCKMSFFTDPDGNPLTLHRRYAPEGK